MSLSQIYLNSFRTKLPGPEDVEPILLGDAIPISGLSPDSPLYDAEKAPEERRSLDNALWLCKMCARRLWKEIEGIPEQVQGDYLLSWKEQAEQRPLGNN